MSSKLPATFSRGDTSIRRANSGGFSVAIVREYGQVSRADICIDDNRDVTCILRRLLMAEICFAIAFGRFCPISNFTVFMLRTPCIGFVLAETRQNTGKISVSISSIERGRSLSST